MRWVFERLSKGSEQLRNLDVYDIAFLAGGAVRVADSAVVALNRRGLLVVHDARVRTVEGETPGHAVERRVYTYCGRAKSVDAVRADMERSREAYEIARRLAAWGLVKGADRRLTRGGRRHLQAAGLDPRVPEHVLLGTGSLDQRVPRPADPPRPRPRPAPRTRRPAPGHSRPHQGYDSDE
ncbi:TIGR04222 domain-containing membrane protein [Streptomyces sp. NPDC051582]|uniref:TIGR04222 domain-containing membrane protein n=1 Tax=Streptomyces sp. NPDC051582 TaxID=3155167 RepID=UPI00343A3542